MDKLESKNKFSFLTKIIITLFVIFGLYYLYYSFGMVKGKIRYDKETEEIIKNLNYKYDELSVRFEKPQRVVGVTQTGRFLELENNIVISFVHPRGDNDAYDKFYIYAKDNLINQYVNVVLPPKSMFIDYPNPLYGEINSQQESIQANVYFKGESLNNKFNFIDPVTTFKDYLN